MSSKLVYNPELRIPNIQRVPLAVITFHDYTKTDRVDSLQKTIDSVQADLPDDAVQYIIPTKGIPFYNQQREQAFRLGDYVTFVDDDDTIVNHGLSLAYAAIKSGNYGVSFTDEALVDEDGNVLSTREGQRTYENVKQTIKAIHHLAIIKAQSLIDAKFDWSTLYGRVQGSDWTVIKIAINQDGAIHVPVIGYNWTQNPNGIGKNVQPITIPRIRITRTGLIPDYQVSP